MSRIIHARIDDKTVKLLREIERQLGWTDSQVIREGIKALNVLLVSRRGRKIAGLGRYRSGIPDLGTNPDHLKGFGR
jgi:hypothetical protein